MKTIILSVRPPWARLLVTGEKTVELRKQKLPGDGGPVRALIYETKAKGGCGALIGEVVFDGESRIDSCSVFADACVTIEEAIKYAAGGELHGWMVQEDSHMVYPTPRPLEGRPPQSWRWA